MKLKDQQPCCGKNLNGVMATDGASEAPEDGDLSVCFYCRAWLVFRAGRGQFVIMGHRDIDALSDEDRAQLETVEAFLLDTVGRGPDRTAETPLGPRTAQESED